MAQLWTIIFVILISIAFSVAAWHDHADAKRQQRRNAARQERNRAGD